jgi:hypothetical protein
VIGHALFFMVGAPVSLRPCPDALVSDTALQQCADLASMVKFLIIFVTSMAPTMGLASTGRRARLGIETRHN